MKLFGIDTNKIDTDAVLLLMDMFAMSYKVVVLRLYESKCITHHQADNLLKVTAEGISKKIELTGRAKRWQLNGAGIESFGTCTLLEKINYNIGHDYLTETREQEDRIYISELKKELHMD